MGQLPNVQVSDAVRCVVDVTVTATHTVAGVHLLCCYPGSWMAEKVDTEVVVYDQLDDGDDGDGGGGRMPPRTARTSRSGVVALADSRAHQQPATSN